MSVKPSNNVARTCEELLKLEGRDSDHRGPWFPSSADFSRAVEAFSALAPPEGFSAGLIEEIAEHYPGVVPWGVFPHPANYQMLLADAERVDLGSVHPARLFLLHASLSGCVSDMPFEREMGGAFCDALMSGAARTLERISEATRERFGEFRGQVRANEHDRGDLLRALSYPLVEPHVIDEFFRVVLDEAIFRFDDRNYSSALPSEREFSWRNISTSPASLIRLLSERKGPHTGAFVDLGCGGGAVMLPMALLTHFDVQGIEIERYWCEVGSKVARSIGRADVVFRQEDLLESSFSGAQVLFIYSPFKASGPLLSQFLSRLSVQTIGSETEIWVGNYPGLQEVMRRSQAFFMLHSCGGLEVYQNAVGTSPAKSFKTR